MAAGAAKSVAFGLLILNLVLCIIVSIIAGWALNYAVDNTPQTVDQITIPAHLFPIYFPIGNMATPFFVVFSLIAGLVGLATSIAGINNILQWNVPSLHSAACFSLTTWGLTLLAMGLACKEINIGGRERNL
ncbi:Awpm-19-like, partial [Thalictrum thalictroides]